MLELVRNGPGLARGASSGVELGGARGDRWRSVELGGARGSSGEALGELGGARWSKKNCPNCCPRLDRPVLFAIIEVWINTHGN